MHDQEHAICVSWHRLKLALTAQYAWRKPMAHRIRSGHSLTLSQTIRVLQSGKCIPSLCVCDRYTPWPFSFDDIKLFPADILTIVETRSWHTLEVSISGFLTSNMLTSFKITSLVTVFRLASTSLSLTLPANTADRAHTASFINCVCQRWLQHSMTDSIGLWSPIHRLRHRLLDWNNRSGPRRIANRCC